MNENTIEIRIKIPDDITILAGRRYGETVYAEQVEPLNIDWSKQESVRILFPETINEMVPMTTSFHGGFFEKVVDAIGFKKIDEIVTLGLYETEKGKSIKPSKSKEKREEILQSVFHGANLYYI